MEKKKSFYFFKRYLDDGERILDVVHRHILVYKIEAAKTSFFGITIPVILYLFFPQAVIIFVIWIAIGLMGLLYHFVDWYFDVWLLTNFGVIDIERDGFFTVTSTRIDYHMMEGVSYTISGFWKTVFNYGDITLDKIGAKTSILLKDAANPRKIERMVLGYQEKFVSEKSVKDHQALKDMLSGMIAYHIQNDKVSPTNNK